MERAELLEHYKLAYAEYRSEVALGWSRARFFVAVGLLGPALAGHRAHVIASVDWLCAFGCLAAFGGALIVWKSHQRYRAARDGLRAIEQQLGAPGFETTGGMREAHGKPRGDAIRVSHILIVMLIVISALNALIAFRADF